MTGHADGLITINIAEADPVERERQRVALREPLRTVLGHLRHEIGALLLGRAGARRQAVADMPPVFGDDSADYGAALEAYYRDGPPADWWKSHVSEYATAHAYEDFAETWTHYLHMVDTLDTAASFGLRWRRGWRAIPLLGAGPRVTPTSASSSTTWPAPGGRSPWR